MAKKKGQGFSNESLQKLVKRANQRIVRIEQRYGKDRWAVKSLKANLDNDLLNAWTEKGRIRIPKTASEDDIEKIRLITKKFLDKNISSLKGIKSREFDIKQTIKEKGKRNDIDISDDEVETIYESLSGENMDWLMEETRLGSDTWIVLAEAKDKRESKDQFVERLLNYINKTNDEDAKEKLGEIYNKYLA